MWSLITNPISTHLIAAFLGAGFTWYATHKTIAATIEASVKSIIASVKSSV